MSDSSLENQGREDLMAGVTILSLNPLLGCIDDFVTPEAARDFLGRLDMGRLKDATIGGSVESDPERVNTGYRSARDIRFARGMNAFVDETRERVTALLNLKTEHCETPSLINYQTGGEYKRHFDSVNFGAASAHDKVSHVRAYTGILYLNDDFEGGGTEFPHLQKIIQPRAGRLVIWQNMAAGATSVHPLTVHAGLPVVKGEKNIISFWMNTPMCLRAMELEASGRPGADAPVS